MKAYIVVFNNADHANEYREIYTDKKQAQKYIENKSKTFRPYYKIIEEEVEKQINSDAPNYLQLDEETRNKEINLKIAELHSMIYQLDWIQILKDAVEARPTSWGVQRGEEFKAVPEWRNASDELIAPVWKNVYQKLEEKEE